MGLLDQFHGKGCRRLSSFDWIFFLSPLLGCDFSSLPLSPTDPTFQLISLYLPCFWLVSQLSLMQNYKFPNKLREWNYGDVTTTLLNWGEYVVADNLKLTALLDGIGTNYRRCGTRVISSEYSSELAIEKQTKNNLSTCNIQCAAVHHRLPLGLFETQADRRSIYSGWGNLTS